jgi:flavin-dependent dehydrogenase
MKYDLIVVGGGPAGLMSVKKAAEDGLKVLLIERKKDLTKIHRACAQIFYIHKVTANHEVEEGRTRADGYIDPVSVELLPDKTRFNFPVPGFSLDYDGPITPYYNWIDLSPSGYMIHRHPPDRNIWGVVFDKEHFLASLLSDAQKAGAEVWPETIGVWAENTLGGVKVRVRGKSSEQTLEASKAIAADGVNSTIAESLGLNVERQVMAPPSTGGGGGLLDYEMEGMEADLPSFSFVWITIPSINPFGNLGIGLKGMGISSFATMGTGNLSSKAVMENFMKHPRFAPWFRNARIVKKMATSRSGGRGILAPLKEPVAGNVVIVGDAAAPIETWIQGAVAMAYMAVKGIEKELNGQKGYSEYIDWWQKAFAFHDPRYWKVVGSLAHLNSMCTDEEVDYLYSLFEGRVGCALGFITKNLELVKKGRPKLYEKLTKSMR